jgi:hypothetical protein
MRPHSFCPQGKSSTAPLPVSSYHNPTSNGWGCPAIEGEFISPVTTIAMAAAANFRWRDERVVVPRNETVILIGPVVTKD